MSPRLLRTALILTALAAAVGATATAADQFDDQTCPNVTPLGIKLNAIVDSTTVLTPELLAASNAMVDGYRACMRGYDNDVYNQRYAPGAQITNAIPVGRVYARLSLARSLQRVAAYAVDDKRFDDARAAYTEALKRLNEMNAIAAYGTEFAGETAEHRLARVGEQLKKDLTADLAALPPAASPAPRAT